MEKLLATIGLLRVKYTYAPADTRPLWIDLTESGFPNAMELSHVQQDLARRKERLLELAVPIALKRAVLDGLFQDLTDPPELLAQLSERTYFDLLDETALPAVRAGRPHGALDRRRDASQLRISWACYDFETNRPSSTS
jgi:hypothetical protein